MRRVLVTAPSVEPVDLDSALDHLRIDAGDEDQYIESLIAVARQHVEDLTGRALLTQTWDYAVDGWPTWNAIKLPFGNLQSVTSVKWKDDAGAETTLTVTTDYLVETNGTACGRIVLPYATPWPSGTLYPSNPITVRFVCGWITADLVPAPIVWAVKMVLAKLYEGRGEDVIGTIIAEAGDKTVMRLLANWRLWDEC